MAKNYDDIGGVWRTIGGRRVFIKTGQDLASAMKASGKFNLSKKQKEAGERLNKNAENGVREDIKAFLSGKEDYDGSQEDFINDLSKEWGVDKDKVEDILHEEKIKHPRLFKNDRQNSKTEAQKYYEKLSEKDIANDLEERKNRLNNNFYDEKDKEKYQKFYEDGKKYYDEKFEVSDLKKKALETLPKDDIDTHGSDLYIKKTKESTALLENMKNKDSGLLSTFKDEKTGETWYDVPFANMEDDYKEKYNQNLNESPWEKRKQELLSGENQEAKRDYEDYKKSTNEIMNNAIREKATKKNTYKEDLPHKTEIKTQGTSNRKEVSENIQAHILEHYDSPQDFIDQMNAMDYLPTKWRAGEELAKGGNYLIYNGDMQEFLNELKINPKGKKFSDDKAFSMYTSLIGRESEKLYNRLQKNAYQKYLNEHPASKITFEEFLKK